MTEKGSNHNEYKQRQRHVVQLKKKKTLIKLMMYCGGMALVCLYGYGCIYWFNKREVHAFLTLAEEKQQFSILNPDRLNEKQRLVRAAYLGDISTFRQLLADGINVNCKEQLLVDNTLWGKDITFKNITPLMAAAIGRRVQMVQSLIAAGAEINARNTEGNTAFCFALQRLSNPCDYMYSLEYSSSLRQWESNVLKDCGIGSDPIWIKLELVRMLIKAGADINIKCFEDKTTMYLLSNYQYSGDTPLLAQLILLLLRNGADVYAKEIGRWILPGSYVFSDDIMKLRLMGDKENRIPLIEAAYRGELAPVKSELASGSNVNIRNIIGETPLIAAAEGGDPDVVDALIKAGAHLYSKDWHGTALTWAVELGHVEVLQVLITAAADVNVHDWDGVAALTRAIERRQVENYKSGAQNKYTKIITMLINAGAALHAVDIDGRTALMEAVELNDYEMAEMLITSGADINAIDVEGQTALLKAFQLADIRMVRILIKHGADININDKKGRSTQKIEGLNYYHESASSGIDSKQWQMILRAFEMHDKISKDLIEVFARSKNSSLEKNLAKELLANWDLLTKAEYLRSPHPINTIENYLQIDKAEKYQIPFLIIAIDVDSIGKVIDAKVIKPKDDNIQKIPVDLDKFKEYICRPAFKDDHFISGSFVSTIIIDYK